MEPDELTPAGWLNRMDQSADGMLARLGDLDASPETKRAITAACAKVIEARASYQVDREERD